MGVRERDSLMAKELQVRCPCGARLAIALDEQGEPEGVLHGGTPCRKFEALEPDHFLTYVRRASGIPDPAEPS